MITGQDRWTDRMSACTHRTVAYLRVVDRGACRGCEPPDVAVRASVPSARRYPAGTLFTRVRAPRADAHRTHVPVRNGNCGHDLGRSVDSSFRQRKAGLARNAAAWRPR